MEKINIAELLKDCPKGMELDCIICDGVVTLEGISGNDSSYPIRVISKDGFHHSFSKFGEVYDHETAKCVIFPKGQTTWEGFVPPCQFKDGDILYCNTNDDGEDYDYYKYVFILKEIIENRIYAHCFMCAEQLSFKETYLFDNEYPICLANKEEKQKLFQAIKNNGYKWNAETKILDKFIEPKFKVGDRIKKKGDYISGLITDIDKDNFYKVEYKSGGVSYVNVEGQNNYELVPGKFDISTLIPFESRVLIRDHESQKWRPAIWGTYEPEPYYPYRLIGTISHCCIPYEGNEHLLNTTNDCDEFYKTWE